MSSSGEGVNPLRPYYIPPSIGETPIATRAAPSIASPHTNATANYASKARDIFPDLDYKDYISEPSPSVVKSIKDLVDELLWRYASVLMAQPFEVAKTILQVRSQVDRDPAQESEAQSKPSLSRRSTRGQVGARACCVVRDGGG